MLLVTNEHEPWGHYVVVRAGSPPWRDEWTNVGVLLYGSDGRLIACRLDTLDRAVRRGSLSADQAARYGDLSWIAARWPIEGDVLRSLESTGHAMSCIQATKPRGTLLARKVGTAIDDIYEDFVAEPLKEEP